MTQREPAPCGTHMTRVSDDSMALRYKKGEWLGIARCRVPKKGRDMILVNDEGDMVLGMMMGWSESTWRIGQLHGMAHFAVRRLSRARWRPLWRVRLRVCCRYSNALYDARALGDRARIEAVERADRENGPLPPPLTDKQIRAIPSVLAWRP